MTVKIMSEEARRQKRLYVRVEPMVQKTKGPHPNLENIINVNDDEHPVLVNNEHFSGHLVFRVRDFDGWTPIDEKTGEARPAIRDAPYYFEGHKRSFSLQISGRFRRMWTGDDIMFGTFFHRKVNLPRGSGIALAFAKRIDPSMEYDLYSEHPYICSPILCAMNTVNIQPLLAPRIKPDQNGRSSTSSLEGRSSLYNTAVRCNDDVLRNSYASLTLPEWQWGGKHEILQENIMSAWPSWTQSPSATNSFYNNSSSLMRSIVKAKNTANHRRQWFLDERHRRRFLFHPDTVYSFDFASPYVDMNRLVLKLGINIDVTKYLGDQPVRYECRTRNGDILFWAVELGLL